MNKVNRHKKTVTLFLCVYIIAAFGIGFLHKEGEQFPLFNGHWFFRVPHMMYDFGVIVKSIDSMPLKDQVYLEKSQGLVNHVWPFALYGSTQQLGKSLRKNNSDDIKKLKSFFKDTVFRGRNVSYEVHWREYDIIEFLNDGAIKTSELIKVIDE